MLFDVYIIWIYKYINSMNDFKISYAITIYKVIIKLLSLFINY